MNEDALACLIGRRCDGILPAPEHELVAIFFDGLVLVIKRGPDGLMWEIDEGRIH